MSEPAPNERGLAVVHPTPLPTVQRGPRLGLPTPDELAMLRAYGEIIVKSGMAPPHVKSPEAAIVIMRYGHQLGIDEFTALQNMYVINGKPVAGAGLLRSLILRDHGGDAIQTVESTAARCLLRCKRRDSAHVTEITYTIEEAKAAGLLEKPGPWKQYPKDMLHARAVSRAGRQVFQDSTLGLYVPEEVGGTVIEVNGEVIDTAAPATPQRATGRLDRLHAIGAARELDHDALHRISVLKLGKGLGEITDTMLRDLESVVETAADAELMLWSLDWEAEVSAAEAIGLPSLTELGERIKSAGVTKQTHPNVAGAYQAAMNRLKANAEPAATGAGVLPGMPTDPDRHTA